MEDYEITFDAGSYNVNVDTSTPSYNLGVSYEIPSKSTQYTNVLVDDIKGQFDGTKTTFDITVGGNPYVPKDPQQLIVSLNDVILQPGVDYQIAGSQITFTPAPTAGYDFWSTALTANADLTRTINFVLDNGSFDITTGSKGQLNLDVTGRIESWMLVADTVGSIVIDVKKDTFATYPDSLTSIVGSEYPRLSSEKKARDESLSTWSTQLTAGDILDFDVVSCSGIKKCSLFLRLII